jgi:hypothetical protein
MAVSTPYSRPALSEEKLSRAAPKPTIPRQTDKAMTKSSKTHSRRIVALLVTVAALSLVGPVTMAQAGNPTNAQYDNEVTKVAAGFGSGGNNNTPTAPAGLQKKVVHGLPFTGLDVVAMLAVAVALTSMGLALRKLTAERHIS